MDWFATLCGCFPDGYLRALARRLWHENEIEWSVLNNYISDVHYPIQLNTKTATCNDKDTFVPKFKLEAADWGLYRIKIEENLSKYDIDKFNNHNLNREKLMDNTSSMLWHKRAYVSKMKFYVKVTKYNYKLHGSVSVKFTWVKMTWFLASFLAVSYMWVLALLPLF